VGYDLHAIAPEIVLVATIVVVLVADFFFEYRERFRTATLAALGVLAAMIPVVTLAVDGARRTLFDGSYAVDPYALVMKGFFLAVAYVTILLSVRASTTCCCSPRSWGCW